MMKIMIKDLKAMLKEKGRDKLPSEMYFSRKKCFTPNLITFVLKYLYAPINLSYTLNRTEIN